MLQYFFYTFRGTKHTRRTRPQVDTVQDLHALPGRSLQQIDVWLLTSRVPYDDASASEGPHASNLGHV
jgi:hypothetical protein